MPYSKELEIMQKKGILREKKLRSPSLLDYASNDYLGLSTHKALLNQTIKILKSYPYHSPIASMAINGYHQIHFEFEEFLKSYFGFPSATLFGSGFLANIALFETLVRKGDVIFIDELYHASGQLPARLLENQAIFFSHNNPQDLREKIAKTPVKGRTIIAIEGIYSMDGDISDIAFSEIAKEFGALLIVDEAHSSGVLGENLKGYFDYHNLPLQDHYIKMGTLSKAYGSYGAFVLAQKNIIDFLFTKAKTSIYTTAPSLFDIALAHCNLNYVKEHTQTIKQKLLAQREAFSSLVSTSSQLAILPFESQERMLEVAKILEQEGFLVGSIRKPTTQTPRLRISLNIKNSKMQTQKLCKILKNLL